MHERTDPRHARNRTFWMTFFAVGFLLFGWLEWRSVEPSAMAWFLETSIWSAVSAIGFTVSDAWILHRDRSRDEERHDGSDA